MNTAIIEIIEKLEAIQMFANQQAPSADALNVRIGKLRMELQAEIDRQEALMFEEMFLRDSDGSACLGIQVAA